MLSVLIRKEITAHLLSLRFTVNLLLFVALVIGSVQMMAANYQKQLSGYAEANERQRAALKEASDFRGLMSSGIMSEKRPNPMSVFSMGLEKEMARSVTVSLFRGVELGGSKYANPLFFLYPSPDLVYVVNIVISLLAILLAFDAVCGEREDQTLWLILSNAVPRDLVLIAKWIAGVLVLTVAFAVAWCAGWVVAYFSASLTLDGDQWLGLISILGVSMVYISTFVTLGLLVSTMTDRSSTSLMIAFFAWVVLVLIVPNVVPILARQMIPAPSAGVIAGQQEAIRREEWRGVRQARRNAQTEEARQEIWDQTSRRIQERSEAIMRDYTRRVDQQVTLAAWLSRISPSSNYMYAATDLAGTGIEDFRALRERIERFQRDLTQRIVAIRRERSQRAAQVKDQAERREIRDAPIDPRALPEFQMEQAGFAVRLHRAMLDILILMVMNLLFFLGAYMRFLRYKMA